MGDELMRNRIAVFVLSGLHPGQTSKKSDTRDISKINYISMTTVTKRISNRVVTCISCSKNLQLFYFCSIF